MKTGYKVSDAMTKKPVVVSPETNLQECARIMAENHVGTLIIKKDGIVEGVISEQDIVRKLVANGINPVGENVKDYMEKKLVTIGPDEDIYDALIKMRDRNIRHLPVLSGSEMVGLLTLKDILKIEPQLFELLVEKFELREESRKPINRIIPNEGICQACGVYSEKIKDKNGSLLCPKCVEEQI
jgi:CBS domain-containing protein